MFALALQRNGIWGALEAHMASQGFIQQLSQLNKFRLHTGNINTYVELKLRRFKNSAEELSACLDIQLKSTPHNSEFKEDGTLLLCDNAHIDNYARGDLKITLKVFLSSWNPDEMKDSVSCLMSELRTKNIELLIISPPELELVEGETEEEELKRWHGLIDPIWTYLSSLVEEGNICSLGLSEANVSQMQLLMDNYDVRASVNHLRHDGCCAVPAELKQFADANDIQLLTHNDPYPFPIRDVFGTFCDVESDKKPMCCSHFETTWAARYTVWVRCRSIMASKGYMVQFQRKEATNGQ